MPPKRHKRKARGPVKGVEEAEEPKTKIAKIEKKEKPNPKDVKGIMKAIMSKPDWGKKIRDEKIFKKYKEEASAQGANKASIDLAFENLLQEAKLENFQNTIFLPSNYDEDNPKYFDDDDYRTGEYEDSGTYSRYDLGYIDNLIPEELRATLEEQLDKIANGPVKDFHPGSDGMVSITSPSPLSFLLFHFLV